MRSLILLSFILVACDDFDPPSLVTDLRVLAVRAEPPEVAPGDTVAIDALVVDPSNRPARYQWYACLLPELGGGGFGGNSDETQSSGGNGTPLSDDPYGGSCWRRVEAGIAHAVALGTDPTASFTVPADLFDTDEALAIAYGLPDGIVLPDSVKSLLLGIAGLNYTIELVVEVDEDAGVRRIEAQKRINVSLAGTADNPVNLNPAAPIIHVSDRAAPTPVPSTPVAAIPGCIGSGSVPLLAGHNYDLFPLNVPTPGVTYPVLLATTSSYEIQTEEETLFYSFFATRPDLAVPVIKAAGDAREIWRLEPGAGAADLWIVVRDGRGGIGWCHQVVAISP